MKASLINVENVNVEKKENGSAIMHLICDNNLHYDVYLVQRDILKAAKIAERGEVASIEVSVEMMGFSIDVDMIVDFGKTIVRFNHENSTKLCVSCGCIDIINAIKQFNTSDHSNKPENDDIDPVEAFIEKLIDNFGVEVISTISSIKSVKDDRDSYRSLINDFIRDINNM